MDYYDDDSEYNRNYDKIQDEKAKHYDRYEELTYGTGPEEYAKRVFWEFGHCNKRSMYDYMGEIYNMNKEELQNEYTNCFCIDDRCHNMCFLCGRAGVHMSLYMKLVQLVDRYSITKDIIKKVKIMGTKIYHTYE